MLDPEKVRTDEHEDCTEMKRRRKRLIYVAVSYENGS